MISNNIRADQSFVWAPLQNPNAPVAEHAMVHLPLKMTFCWTQTTDHERPSALEVFHHSKSMNTSVGIALTPRHLCGIPQRRRPDLPWWKNWARIATPTAEYFKKAACSCPHWSRNWAVIEKHLKAVGLMESEDMKRKTPNAYLAEKRADFEANQRKATNTTRPVTFPPTHTMWQVHTKGGDLGLMDGCVNLLELVV